ncbi:MAG: GatB/YqeY domain-containing protein [Actinomycetota bacterium]|nr:GatB/YqeY domain-containing protein [Actinomycetota bacterium]
MTALKAQLQANLTIAMKARDQLTASTLRMALTAVTNEEVSGKQARVLSDDEVLTVLGKEAKKRREAVEAYGAAQRPDLAAKERDELGVLEAYLPEGLSADEVQAIIDTAVAQAAGDGLTGGAAMGAVMKLVQPQVKGRADGGAVAAGVKAALGLG